MKPSKYQTKRFIAYDYANCEIEYFDTKDEAEKWLTQNDCEGISKEAENGYNWIAEIKWRSVFHETDRKDNYHEHTDDCPEDCDKEEWPYESEFDYVGEIKYEEIDYDNI